MAIKNSDVFIPDVLADAVKTGFPGMAIMSSSGAAIINTDLKAGNGDVGSTVKIPYFANLGEAEDLATDDASPTLATFTSSNTNATVTHSVKAFEMTYWAKQGAGDPYKACSEMVLEACKRRFDKALIDVAANESGYTSMINDVSGAGSGLITIDALTDTRQLFGDEANDFAAFACHSKVFTDMLKTKDSSGRNLLIDFGSGNDPFLKPLGIPVIVSDRLPKVSSVYSSLLLKKGSLALYANGTPEVLTDKDVKRNVDIVACHFYWAAARYSNMAGMAKSGVAILKTK